jgi:uncharacterized protein with GYD domain
LCRREPAIEQGISLRKGDFLMSLYMFQAAYTADSWKHQVERRENPQDRLRPLVEGLDGHIEGMFYAFGEYDIIVLAEMPNEEAATAFSLAASAGGSVKAIKTTPLLTVEQGLNAMKKASEAGKRYHPPVAEETIRETVRR